MQWLKNIFNRTDMPRPAWWQHYVEQIAQSSDSKTPLENIPFVVFDTESTGLHPLQDRILSIGAIGVQNNDILVEDRFECFLRHPLLPKTEAVTVHGILPGERENMLDEAVALEYFFNFTGSAVLVGHHIDFDCAILNAALRRTGLPKLKNKTIDTSRLALRLQPPSAGIIRPGAYSLDALCKQYKIPPADRHTAAGDAFITAQLFLKLTARLQKRGNRTLGDLLK